MRLLKMIELFEKYEVLSIQFLLSELGLSERSIRDLLKQLKIDGETHGFIIRTIRSKGYSLYITSEESYQMYKEDFFQHTELSAKEYRIPILLYFLLQSDEYTTIDKLASLMDVSRNTVLRDLPELKEHLMQLDLELVTKKNHGIKVIGEESILRKAISKYVIHSYKYTLSTQNYFYFLEHINEKQLKEFFHSVFSKYNVLVSEEAKASIIDHCKILLYRSSIKNYLYKTSLDLNHITKNQMTLALVIIQGLEELYQIEIPTKEVDYLAVQIAAKTSVEHSSMIDREKIISEINRILLLLDHEYLTDFSADQLLKEALLMHMYPLLNRAQHKIEFQNPLIEQVSSEYANVFLIAIRFASLWTQPLHLSSDEIGYLALHFASNLERQKNKIIERYKRILIISKLGRSNILYLKEKIQNHFKSAIVEVTLKANDTESINQMGADLILSTMELEKDEIEAPVILIKEMLNDQMILNIKEQLLLLSDTHQLSASTISNLMQKEMFFVTDETEYLTVLSKCAQELVKLNYADEDFPSSVLERELSFTTIYENGVAGPHGMKLNAKKDSVAFIIPKNKMIYTNKEVKLIILINLKKGSLFLYKKISDFILEIMESDHLLKLLYEAKQYDQFLSVIRDNEKV